MSELREVRPEQMSADEQDVQSLASRLDRLWSASADFSPPTVSIIGQRIAHFRIRSLLGSGAFGVVYLAVDCERDRAVALKLPRVEVLMDPEKRERFAAEAATAIRLDHPGIVAVYEVNVSGPTPYIAAEWCDGPDLSRWLESFRLRTGELSQWTEVADLIAQVADAVDYAHRQGVIHRDLKPANIQLARNRPEDPDDLRLSDFRPRITDFGLAKLADPLMTETRASLLIGTPMYMAPERLAPQRLTVTGHSSMDSEKISDLYSLGVILFESLTGNTPISGTTYFELLDRVRNHPPLPLDRFRHDLPVGMQRICDACLQKNPTARYRSVAELASDLRRCIAGQAVVGRRISWMSRSWYWCEQPERRTIAGWFAILCQGIIIAWVLETALTIAQFDIVSPSQWWRIRIEAALIIAIAHVPLVWIGWRTLQGRPWGPMVGCVLTIVQLPAIALPLLFEPLVFRDLYLHHPSYFPFHIHSVLVLSYMVQAFFFGCAWMGQKTRAVGD